MREIYINSDNIITLGPLADAVTGLPVTTATVSAVIKSAGVAVGSPITLTHIADGRYRGNIEDTVGLVTATQYVLEITTTNSGTVSFKKIPFVAIYDVE